MVRFRSIILLSVMIVLMVPTVTIDASTLQSEYSGPYVDKILYKVIDSDDQQVLALLNNEVDLMGDWMDPVHRLTLEEAEDVEVVEHLRNGYGYLTINTAKNPFNYTAFRRAFAFALDKEAVAESVWDGLSVPLDSCIPRMNPFSCEGLLPYTYYESNIELGNALLDDAGFQIDGMTGFRTDPHGNPFSVILEFAQPGSTIIEGMQLAAEALQALYVNATSEPTDFYNYLNRLYFHGDYDMVFLGDDFDNFDVDWLATEYWSETVDEPYHNFPNWVNSTYDSWRDQLLHATDFEDVYEAAFKMQEIWVHACPMIIMYQNTLLSAYRTDKFEGYVNDALQGVAGWWTNQKIHLIESDRGLYGGTFRWSNPLDLDTFNFMASTSSYTQNVLQMLYDSLFRYDAQGNMIPWLVESYDIETNEDNPNVGVGNTRFSIEIVKNATWSDGVPLSAQDVAYTYNFYREGEDNPYGEDLVDLLSAYAPTDYTFIIEFEGESYWHISKLVKPILPKHYLLDVSPENWSRWVPDNEVPTLVTSGPFYVNDYVAGEYTELAVNEYYFRSTRWREGDENDDAFKILSSDGITKNNPIIIGEIAPYAASEGQSSLQGTSRQFVSMDMVVAEDEDISLTWTANDNHIPSELFSGNIVDGDHILVNASYNPGNALNMTLDFISGIYFNETQSLVIPDSSYDIFSGMIDESQYSWMTVEGIKAGDIVFITANFTNGDSDFLAWWNDTDSSTWSYSNNLLGSDMSSGAKPETIYFQAERDGTLRVACFCYDLEPGFWTLVVDTQSIVSVENEGSWVTFDTYEFEKNVTVALRVSGYNETEHYFETEYDSIRFNNFFAPVVDLISPWGGEIVSGIKLILWEATSRNINHDFTHEILISNDGGQSYQLFATGLVIENRVWYADNWKFSNQYMLMVRTYDRGMVGIDVTNTTFSAGNPDLIDTEAPCIIGIDQMVMEYGSVNNTLVWLVIDLHPGWFSVYVNEQLQVAANLSYTRSVFVVNCDDFEVGVHNVFLSVVDEYGNAASSSVWVGVLGPTSTTQTSWEPTSTTSTTTVPTSSSVTTSYTTHDTTTPTGFWEGLTQMILLAITFGSVTIIIVFSVLIIKNRKS